MKPKRRVSEREKPCARVDAMASVYLGLGSNLGDREANLNEALRRLAETPGVTVRRVSRFIVSAPWGVTDQPEFLNGVAEVETSMGPEALLAALKEIEGAMGRQPAPRWGPRLIDLDLLLYDRVRRRTPALTLPHPEILRREFVWGPLSEIAPEALEELRRDAALPL
jgi:2-amino-4-hydroxy-6-hydroxymethyldihydropteridine diphosphokinase